MREFSDELAGISTLVGILMCATIGQASAYFDQIYGIPAYFGINVFGYLGIALFMVGPCWFFIRFDKWNG